MRHHNDRHKLVQVVSRMPQDRWVPFHAICGTAEISVNRASSYLRELKKQGLIQRKTICNKTFYKRAGTPAEFDAFLVDLIVEGYS